MPIGMTRRRGGEPRGDGGVRATAHTGPHQPTSPAGAATTPAPSGNRIGEHLVEQGAVAPDQVERALALQHLAGGRLGEILVAQGQVAPWQLSLALAHQSDLPSLVPEYEAVPLLPRAIAYRHRAAVLAGPAGRETGRGTVLVAVTDLDVVPALRLALGAPVEPRLTDARTMDALLADAYAHDDGREASRVLRRLGTRRALGVLATVALSALATLAGAGAYLHPLNALVAAVGLVAAYWLTMAHVAARSGRADPMPDPARDASPSGRSLPAASVLVPLRRETPGTLRRLRRSLEELDYPNHKLQAIALLDPADRETRRSLRSHPLPPWVTLLVVPREAATGRRGLLIYGLRQARGELVIVARADGSPAPDALRRAPAHALDAEPARPVGLRAEARRRRRVARRFLREAHPTLPAASAVAAGARARRRQACFEGAELQAAFGWEPAYGTPGTDR
jgi:hypothetical protein